MRCRGLRIEASMPQDDTVNNTYRPPSTTSEKTRILVLAPVGTFVRTSLNACVCIEPGHGSMSLACKNYHPFHGPPTTLADTRFEEAVRRCYFCTSIQTFSKAKPGRTTFSIKTVLNSRGVVGTEALPFDKCCPRPVQHSAPSATSQ